MGILTQLHMARLQSHGTLLKYQVEKHEADSLFAVYQKKCSWGVSEFDGKVFNPPPGI